MDFITVKKKSGRKIDFIKLENKKNEPSLSI